MPETRSTFVPEPVESQRHSPFISRLLFTLALLTLLAIAAREFLPEKRWQWIPEDTPQINLYADAIFGGNSSANWVDQENIHLECTLRETGQDFPPFCGFHALFNPSEDPPVIDLSGYRRVHVEVDYRGDNGKLRFFISDFVEGWSTREDPVGTGKYMSVYIPVEEARQELVIDMDEFILADWWVNNRNVPRKYAKGSTAHAVAFGIDVAYPSALGEHELQLKRVTFYGDWISAENWYLGILLFWSGTLITIGTVRLAYFRRLALAERRRRAHVLAYASQLREEKQKYHELSIHDQLTGLLNRHGLSDFCTEELQQGNSWPVAVVLMDIDHFKPINDSYGHDVGDRILCRVAKAIADHCRQSDRVVRWGGEEFLALLPRASLEEAVQLAERLRRNVANLAHPEIGDKPVTLSFGVGVWSGDSTLEEVFRHVDAALYRAKNNGRNRIETV